MSLRLDRIGRVRAASRNPLTLVGRDICASHVLEVWDMIPKYIHEELERGIGLRIPGLVTFGCKIIKNCSYPQMFTMDKFVHMVISEDLVNMYGLHTKRPNYTLNPSNNLNISKISTELNMPRYAVNACLTEVIHAFQRAITTYTKVEFIFEGIGKLVVHDNLVYSSFCPDFMEMHGFGERVIDYKYRFPCVCEPEPEQPKPATPQYWLNQFQCYNDAECHHGEVDALT